MTAALSANIVDQQISIPTALAGCDLSLIDGVPEPIQISIPTALAGCDQQRVSNPTQAGYISIPTALAGCDGVDGALHTVRLDFNPHSPRGL